MAFAAHDFTDVPDSHPFHDHISWMASSGVSEGFPDGTYRPGEPVTLNGQTNEQLQPEVRYATTASETTVANSATPTPILTAPGP